MRFSKIDLVLRVLMLFCPALSAGAPGVCSDSAACRAVLAPVTGRDVGERSLFSTSVDVADLKACRKGEMNLCVHACWGPAEEAPCCSHCFLSVFGKGAPPSAWGAAASGRDFPSCYPVLVSITSSWLLDSLEASAKPPGPGLLPGTEEAPSECL